MVLKEFIEEAAKKGVALGHFNASTIDGIWAIVDAARELKVPVIIGLSEGERDYIGVRQAAAIVRSIREEKKIPVFLNADHTYSFERVKEAVDAGFDSVIFDGAELPLEQNIEITRKCVQYAKDFSKKNRCEVLIEGELGFIGKSSKILDSIPEGAAVKEDQMTKPEDAARFAEETGIDLLAPAVGNIHGMIKGGDPALHPERVAEIFQAAKLPLVLHGASGNSAEEIKECIKAGVSIVHVNTELRVAYRCGLVRSLSDGMDEVAPYKFMKPAKLSMQKVVEEKLKIFQEIK